MTSPLPQPFRESPRIVLPVRPEKPVPRGLPILATVAPVFASVALWAITQSPFALVFAALGPVIAVASVGDARLQARTLRRREAARFAADCDSALAAIAAGHDQERAERAALHPGSPGLLATGSHAPEFWRHSLQAPLPVRIGCGWLPSALELQADASPPVQGDDEVEGRLRELRQAAAVLPGAPVVVDACFGIGIVGPAPLALAVARAVVLQLSAMLLPAATEIALHAGENEGEAYGLSQWQWLDLLPHRRADSREGGGASSRVVFAPVGQEAEPVRSAVVAVASSLDQLPREARIVIHVGGAEGGLRATGSGGSLGAVLQHPEHGWRGELHPDFVSLEQATAWARAQRERARTEGAVAARGPLPASVQLLELLGQKPAGGEALEPGLGCALGIGEDGAFWLDLVSQGPHAVVGGTTGSGKSELLVTWVLGIAARRPPAVVTFLFVDFKGGASFEPLRGLPHCVGVITDLDGQEALRALGSLRAEIRYRERSLAAARLRSLDEARPGSHFPRLVLVVDEYAAMVEEHPDLHPLFTDLAARGRSLGIHLILCTQRPAGVMREGVLANCALRLSLKVNNRADSIAVIGTDAAAALGASPQGRAFVSAAGAHPRAVQVALATEADAQAVASQWATVGEAPRRPWCPPLPPVVGIAAMRALLDGERGNGERGRGEALQIPFALADLPAEQRQGAARFVPAADGHLLVIGGSGSGKSGVLSALAAAGSAFEVVRVAARLDLMWDELGEALAHEGEPKLLLLDDVDALVTSCQEDYSAAIVELLARVLRQGPARGVHLVLTMQRVPGQLQSLTSLCGSRLLLRMPNRQEHLLAGGESAAYAADLPPGAGHWRGGRVQVVLASTAGETSGGKEPRAVDLAVGRDLVVVSTQPTSFAGRLRAAHPNSQVVELSPLAGDPRQLAVSTGGARPVLVADPETWQSHWGAIGALRASADVVFDGCTIADLRQLARLRELPPPFEATVRPLWVLTGEGRLARARLAAAGSSADVPN